MTDSDLKTARLLGRPITSADFGRLRSIHADPRAAATLAADGLPFSRAHTRRSIEAWTEHWLLHGFGVWVFHKADGEFVGYAGIMRSESVEPDSTELLYAVRPEFWNQGYAREMSRAVLQFAFEWKRLKSVIAFTLPTNVGSRRVMEKCGFRYERDIVHAGLPHVLYRLHSEDKARTQDE